VKIVFKGLNISWYENFLTTPPFGKNSGGARGQKSIHSVEKWYKGRGKPGALGEPIGQAETISKGRVIGRNNGSQ
jgi:hypothetical protein